MRDSLLKEAVADAKAIHNAAVANAKLSLEESFRPHLANMLSARLRNEVEGLTEDNDASSEIASNGVTVDEPAPKEPSKASSDSSHIENPGLEVEPLGEGLEDLEGGEDEYNLDSDPAIDPTMGGDVSADPSLAPAPEGDFGAGEGDVDDLDLDAIIRELEADINDGGADAMASPTDVPPATAPAAPTEPEAEYDPELGESFDEVDAGKKVNGAFDGSVKSLEETLAGDGDEGVHKDGKSPAAVDGVNGGKKVTPGQTVTGTAAETMTEGEEVDLDELLRVMEAEDESGNVLESEKIATENVELKRALREHREVVHFLRGKLQEVNLLNSKLLFTNKLFRNFSLNLKQKMHVVESLDRATNVREAKLIYTTLAEAYLGKAGSATKNNSAAKTITEGMASKPSGSTKPKSKPVLAESNDLVARMQKLAGIKIS